MSSKIIDISELKTKSPLEIYNYIHQKKLWYINIILTFDYIPQEIYDVLIPICDTDSKFLKSIFKTMCKEKLKTLVKISSCMEYEYDFPSFLMKRDGKYYFNTNMNKDPDTRSNKDLKNAFINS